MKKGINAVNAAHAPVVEAQWPEFDPAKGTATTPKDLYLEGAREREIADPHKHLAKQGGASASFAVLRRRVQQLERLLSEQCACQREWLQLLEGIGAQENPQGELNQRHSLLKNPLYGRLQEEKLRYRRLAHLRVLGEDLMRIQNAFPQREVLSLEELGEAFFDLREAGIDPVTACAAVWQSQGSHTDNLPPQMGSMHHTEQGTKDYYTPNEVDRLTKHELMDPRVMAAVEYSMTKWKKK